MSEIKIQPFQIHTVGQSDFDFTEKPNSIYTVGQGLLKEFDFYEQKVVTDMELEQESFAIATFPPDRSQILLGFESGIPELYSGLEKHEQYPMFDFKDTPVCKIVMSVQGNYIACCTNRFECIIYNTIQNKHYIPKPSHEKACLHIGFNHTEEYICSSGCEGVINIYSIDELQKNPLLAKISSHRISEETEFESLQILRFDWHPNDNLIALPGKNSLQLLKQNENESWSLSSEPQIFHENDLSAVCWNFEGRRLLTFCVDKIFKLWDFKTKQILQFFNSGQPIYSCKYSVENRVFGYMTHDGYFGVWKDSENFNGRLKNDEPFGVGKKMKRQATVQIEDDEEDYSFVDKMIEEEAKEKKGKKNDKEERMEEEEEEIPETLEVKDKDETEIEKERTTKDIYDEFMGETKPKAKTIEEEEEIPNRVISKKKRQYQHSDIIDVSPQSLLYPSSTFLTKGKRFLCWNLVGSVIISEEDSFVAIDVDFANKNFHSNFRFIDDYGFSMACLSEKGILLASKSEEVNLDEYENENLNENRKFSNIFFRPLNFLTEREKEWIHPLPEGENVESLAIGNNWFAATTSINFIRFFNFKGLETKVLCLDKPIVCSAGYENLLAIVYHSSPPFLGCQSLSLRVIDVEKHVTIYCESCPISPRSTLTWFGFSDTGMIITQDSRGIMRGLAGFNQWIPLYFAEESSKTAKFWLIGVHEYNFIGCIPEKDDIEPAVNPRPAIKVLKIKFPFIKEEDGEVQKQSEILKNQTILEHERFRSNQWFNYKITREKTDNLYRYSDTVQDKMELLHTEDTVEKGIVQMIHEHVTNSEYEKALILASTLKKMKSLDICLIICNNTNATPLIPKINDLIEARRKLDKIEEAQQTRKVNGDGIIVVRGNDSTPILGNKDKSAKKGLSAYAVPLHERRREIEASNLEETPERNYKRESKNQVENFLNLLEEFEGEQTEEIEYDKERMSEDKAPKTLSQEKLITPTQEVVKRLSFEQDGLKRTTSLFEKFSGNTHTNPLKRKPNAALVRNDIKKSK